MKYVICTEDQNTDKQGIHLNCPEHPASQQTFIDNKAKRKRTA